METRRHVHEETFPATDKRLFEILHTPSAIRHWWRASRAIVVPKVGGVWSAAWGDIEDSPDFVTMATIREFDAPRRLELADYAYFAKTGPLPFHADFTTTFSVAPADDGATLRVEQNGFPTDASADAFYAACAVGWKSTFTGIRNYLTAESKGGRHARVFATTSLFVVADLQRSMDFYQEKLGFRDPSAWGEPPCFAMMHRDGFDIMLKTPEADGQIHPNGPFNVWDMYIKVTDIEAESKALTAAGVAIVRGPERSFYDIIELEVLDPDGYRICFGQPVGSSG